MATFTNNPTEWERLDWQLLQNSPVTIYFDREILESDVSWFRADGYRVLSIRAAEHSSPEALLVALGKVLAFPDYFGRNLDAFNDCLSDVEVPDAGGLLLVLDEYAPFTAYFRREAQAVLDICADQARRFLLIGRRFVVLVQSGDPTLTFDPVGASPVMWNPREWLNANRGL
ncbi:MAG TPA: barstar family protein [Polyangiaceae bacterium]|nr:barstar family protein [Polyangiaceae bacterium]